MFNHSLRRMGAAILTLALALNKFKPSTATSK